MRRSALQQLCRLESSFTQSSPVSSVSAASSGRTLSGESPVLDSACSTSYASAYNHTGRGSCWASGSRRGMAGYGKIMDAEKGKTKFSGYYAGGFYINNVQMPGSVLTSNDMYMMWRPRTMDEITPESLVFLELIKPAPDMLVLGTGLKPAPVPPDIVHYLNKLKMKVEVLDSRNAPGMFNVLNEEGRVVVGALLACDPDAPLPEIMPERKEPFGEVSFGQKDLGGGTVGGTRV